MLWLPGCATYDRHGLEATRANQIETKYGLKTYSLSLQLENKILALNPEHVTATDLKDVLARAPASAIPQRPPNLPAPRTLPGVPPPRSSTPFPQRPGSRIQSAGFST